MDRFETDFSPADRWHVAALTYLPVTDFSWIGFSAAFLAEGVGEDRNWLPKISAT
jgi:hypothetical protein